MATGLSSLRELEAVIETVCSDNKAVPLDDPDTQCNGIIKYSYIDNNSYDYI